MKVFLTKQQIAKRVKELAKEISRDYEGKDLACVAILKGSFIFAADLIRELDIPVRIDFITLGSYEGTKSTGHVRKVGYFGGAAEGKHVLVIEDIIDTGYTLDFLKRIPTLAKAASIKTCCLLDKKCARKKEYEIDYAGFEVPDVFTIGYGMDYSQKYRNLPDIYILGDE